MSTGRQLQAALIDLHLGRSAVHPRRPQLYERRIRAVHCAHSPLGHLRYSACGPLDRLHHWSVTPPGWHLHAWHLVPLRLGNPQHHCSFRHRDL
eukprot:s2481_g6.t1